MLYSYQHYSHKKIIKTHTKNSLSLLSFYFIFIKQKKTKVKQYHGDQSKLQKYNVHLTIKLDPMKNAILLYILLKFYLGR